MSLFRSKKQAPAHITAREIEAVMKMLEPLREELQQKKALEPYIIDEEPELT